MKRTQLHTKREDCVVIEEKECGSVSMKQIVELQGESSLKSKAKELNKDNNEGLMDLGAHIPELESLTKADDLTPLNLS